jgi:hypothetical protein
MDMDKKITLTFTENHKYRLEFSPPGFWMVFARGYDALTWEMDDSRLAVVAENYSYLLDLLVQARLYNLSTMPRDARLQ